MSGAVKAGLIVGGVGLAAYFIARAVAPSITTPKAPVNRPQDQINTNGLLQLGGRALDAFKSVFSSKPQTVPAASSATSLPSNFGRLSDDQQLDVFDDVATNRQGGVLWHDE